MFEKHVPPVLSVPASQFLCPNEVADVYTCTHATDSTQTTCAL